MVFTPHARFLILARILTGLNFTPFLTGEGTAVRERMIPMHAWIAEDALAPLSADERQTLKTLLAKLENALSSHPGTPGAFSILYQH